MAADIMATSTTKLIFSLKCAQSRFARRSKNGLVIVECFSPAQEVNRNRNDGYFFKAGPPTSELVSTKDLEKDFYGCEILDSTMTRRVLNEGKFHRGEACVTQFVAKFNPDNLKFKSLFSWRKSIDAVFDDVNSGSTPPNSLYREDFPCEEIMADAKTSYLGNSAKSDKMLFCAPQLLAISCWYSTQRQICRYCGVSECFCDSIYDSVIENRSAPAPTPATATAKAKTTVYIDFVVLSHPNEFLKSTSTAKIAVQALQGAKNFVYGSKEHDAGFAKLSSASRIRVLYPCPDSFDKDICSETVEEMCHNSTTTPTTVFIPDGTWENTKALVSQLFEENNDVKFVTLDSERVEKSESKLLSELYQGAGVGRLSTLEAIGMALTTGEDANFVIANSNAEQYLSGKNLNNCLDPLLNHVRAINSATLIKSDSNNPDNDAITQMQDTINKYNSPSPLFPIGLRRCIICGSAMSTYLRMKNHLSGRKHCEAILSKGLDFTSSTAILNAQISDSADFAQHFLPTFE